MTSANRGVWFYAHAGGLADVQFVFEAILKKRGEYDITASFSGSSAIIVHCRRKGGKNVWHFVDSFWLFRDSLASIGRSIGRAKSGPKALDNATQADIKRWYAEAPESELIPYNENDCRILYEAIERFQHRILEAGSQLQMTIASNAMQLFRRQYLKQDIGTHKYVNEIGRKAYFASRVEVLQSRCEDANYLDINSSFPFAMTKPVPGELLRTSNRLPTSDGKLYLADVEIEVPESFLPPLATRVDGRLFFPVGKWRSWLTGIDIELLLREGGKIHKTHEVLYFSPNADLRDYALDIYEKRKQSNDPFDRIVYKYLLNSLYGKFAERPEKEKLYVFPDVKTLNKWNEAYTREELDAMMLMPGVYVEPVTVDIQHEHTPIAAYITARARQTLYDFMTHSEEGSVFYCDTDGFATLDEFPTSKELGGLKLEKRHMTGMFAAPKMYRMDGEILQDDGSWKQGTLVKAKGFSLRKGDEAIKRFEMLMEGMDIEVDRMSRLREELSSAGRKTVMFKPRETVIKKRFRNELVTKRLHYPDGHTRPWHIEELLSLSR